MKQGQPAMPVLPCLWGCHEVVLTSLCMSDVRRRPLHATRGAQLLSFQDQQGETASSASGDDRMSSWQTLCPEAADAYAHKHLERLDTQGTLSLQRLASPLLVLLGVCFVSSALVQHHARASGHPVPERSSPNIGCLPRVVSMAPWWVSWPRWTAGGRFWRRHQAY